MQTNDFRSATNLQSLRRSRSDNTFATAKNLGNAPLNATSVSFRASGTVDKSDKVDFYKWTVSPGVNLPSGFNRFRLRNGSVTLSTYAEVVGERAPGPKITLQRGPSSRTSSLTNPTQFPFTFYFKVERRTGNARYNLSFNFFR